MARPGPGTMAGLAGRPRSPPNPSASLNIVEETTTAQKQAMSAEMMKLLNKHITDLRDKIEMRKAGLREDGDPASQSYYSKHIKTLAKRRAAARRKARSSDAEPQQKVTMEMLFRHDALPSGSGASPTSAHGAGGLDSSGLGGRARARQGRGLKRELGALERKLHHMTDGSLIRSVEDVVYDAHDPPRFRLDSATLYQYVVEQSSLSHGRKVVVKYMLHPLSLQLLQEVFWLMHCRFFQPDSQAAQLQLLDSVSAIYVRMVQVLGRYQDVFFKYYPYVMSGAICWCFYFLCPGSRHRYTALFKTKLNQEVFALITGVPAVPRSVQIMRQQLFPHEDIPDLDVLEAQGKAVVTDELEPQKQEKDKPPLRPPPHVLAAAEAARRAHEPLPANEFGVLDTRRSRSRRRRAPGATLSASQSAAAVGSGNTPRRQRPQLSQSLQPLQPQTLSRPVSPGQSAAGGHSASATALRLPPHSGHASRRSLAPPSLASPSVTLSARRVPSSLEHLHARPCSQPAGGGVRVVPALASKALEPPIQPTSARASEEGAQQPTRVRQCRAYFNAATVNPMVQQRLQDDSTTLGRAGFCLKRTTPTARCVVGGVTTFRETLPRFAQSRSIVEEHRRDRVAAARQLSELRAEMGQRAVAVDDRAKRILRSGVAHLGRFCMDLMAQRHGAPSAVDTLRERRKAAGWPGVGGAWGEEEESSGEET